MATVRIPDTYRNMLDEICRLERLAGRECSISSLTREALDDWGVKKKSREAGKKKRKIVSML